MATQQPDSAEVAALRHWANYGQPGEPQAKRVVKEDWKAKEFDKPVTSNWNVKVPKDAVPALLNGFKPQEMEDKWFVYTDGPDDDGIATIHMFRSWTGFPMFEVKLHVPVIVDEPGGDGGAAAFTEITWESSPERISLASEGSSKDEAMTVCSWVLGVHLNDQSTTETDD
jgi:hypothetical protein